jgi:hypothetical protein
VTLALALCCLLPFLVWKQGQAVRAALQWQGSSHFNTLAAACFHVQLLMPIFFVSSS